jgi:hypothetical protein
VGGEAEPILRDCLIVDEESRREWEVDSSACITKWNRTE